jgi:hypothetical protein
METILSVSIGFLVAVRVNPKWELSHAAAMKAT